MKHKSLFEILKTMNIPVAYDHFSSDKKVEPPFMAYREQKPDTFKADGLTYYRPYNYEIELVTIKKEPALEERLEELLTANKIPYDKGDESWDKEEKIYHNFYEI